MSRINTIFFATILRKNEKLSRWENCSFSKASIQSNNVTYKDFVGRLQVWCERITSKKVRQIFVCISGLFYLNELDFVSKYYREDFCIIFHKLILFCEKLKEKEEENSDSRAKNNLEILLEKTENGFHSTRGLFSVEAVEVWVEYLGRT